MAMFIVFLRILLGILTVINFVTGDRERITHAIAWLKEKHRRGIGAKLDGDDYQNPEA